MRTATAKVAVERGPHVFAGGIGVSHQKRGGAHQDAGNAIAALQRLLGDKRPLQRMWLLLASQPFDGRDVLVRDRRQRRVARGHGVVADNDVAGAAFIGPTAEMRAGDAELPAQDIEQRSIRIGIDRGLGAIEVESDARHRERDLDSGLVTYGLSPNFLTTSAHFTISPRRYFSNSSGVIDIGTTPCLVQSFMISGRLTAAFTAAFSLSITGFGVPAGAINPSQMVASYPGTPASPAVGTFGSTLERVLPVVASARTWFSATLGAIAGTASIIICTCPPITPLRASPLLR